MRNWRFFLLSFGVTSASCFAASVEVTSADDSGTGTLRSAITTVNAGTADTIDVTLTSGTTITISTAVLPTFTQNATLTSNPFTLAGTNALKVFNIGTTTFTFNQTGDGSFTGFITGTGTVDKKGTNTVALTGTASGAWATTLTSGTLAVSSNTNIGTGTITFSSGTLQVTDDATFTNGVIAGGTLSVDTDKTATFSGVVTGGGSMTFSGAGTTVFSGVNDYTGGTAINAGTLSVAANSGLGNAAGGLSFNGGTLKGTGSISNSRAITLNSGGGTFDDDGNSNTFSGVISGEGALTKAGAGTLTLSGANTYQGGTTISAGTISIDADTRLGDVTTNAAVTLDGGTLTTSAGISTARPITLSSGGGTLNDGGNSSTFSGVISGSGALTKAGAGTATFSGTNTFTGGTTVSAGTLSIAGDANLGGSSGGLTLASGTTLAVTGTTSSSRSVSLSGGTPTINVAAGTTTTMGGNFSGSGGLTKAGTGTLVLNGTSSYSGNTTVSAGTLQGDSDSLIGTISNSGAVVFNQGSDGTYAGALSGAGTIAKQGIGNLTISGSAASTSATAISITGGKLTVNGTLTNSTGGVSVGVNGTLGGTGTVTGDIAVSGTVAPGNSIGTLTVVGDTTFASGSRFEAEVSATTSDLLTVSGTVTINGGTLVVIPVDTGIFYNATTTHTVIHGDTAVTGTFDATTLSTISPLFGLGTVAYLANDVQVTLIRNPFASVITKGNPGKVASYLDTLNPVAGSDLSAVMADLLFLNLKDLKEALNQLQPANYKGMILAQENNAVRLASSVTNRLEEIYKTECSREYNACRGYSIWGDGYADFFSMRGEKFFPGFSTHSGGFVLGGDRRFCHNITFGAMVGYTGTSLSWNQSQGHADISSYYAGLYGGWAERWWFVNGSVVGAYTDYDASRKIKFPGLSRKARTDHNGHNILGHIDGGALFCYHTLEFRPFAGVDYVYLKEGEFSEKGADSINLKVDASDATLWRGELGVKFANVYNRQDCWKIIPELKLSYIYEGRPDGSSYTARFKQSGGSFTVKGEHPDKHLFAPGFSISYLNPAARSTFSLRWDGEFGDKYRKNSGQLEFTYNF